MLLRLNAQGWTNGRSPKIVCECKLAWLHTLVFVKRETGNNSFGTLVASVLLRFVIKNLHCSSLSGVSIAMESSVITLSTLQLTAVYVPLLVLIFPLLPATVHPLRTVWETGIDLLWPHFCVCPVSLAYCVHSQQNVSDIHKAASAYKKGNGLLSAERNICSSHFILVSQN